MLPPLFSGDLRGATDTMRRWLVGIDAHARRRVIGAVPRVTAADAVDDATVWALANELKTTVNALLDALNSEES